MENNAFKGSLFGGFNRADVIDYITKSSAESTARIASLEADVDKLCEQERELRASERALQTRNDALSAELTAAESERDALREAKSEADAALAALRAEVEALRTENAALRAETESLRPLAEQYAAVKAHLAGIELDAHERAETYERSVRERLDAMLDDCRAQCSAVLATLGDTCATVTGELRRAESSISTLPAAFTALRTGLETLGEKKDA